MTTVRGRRARGPLSRYTFLSLYFPAVAIAMGQAIAAPALPLLVKSFGIGFGEAALVSVMYGFGGLAGTLPTGYLIDRFGRRPVLLLGPALTAVTSLLTAFASPTFSLLLVWRFLAGAASQGWELSRLAMIADAENERERGRLLKWMFQMSQTGALLAPSIGGLAAEIDVRVPFVLFGGLALISILPSVWILEETAPARTGVGAAGGAGSWGPVLKMMFQREMAAFLVAQFLANVARGLQASGVINLYMAYAYNASALLIGLLNTVSGIVTTPVGFVAGAWLDRWGRKRTTVPGFAALCGAMLIVAATAQVAAPFAVFAVAFVLLNVVQSVVGGVMQVMGADLAPAVARGRFIGTWRLVGRGGTAVGPALFGSIAELWGYAPAFGALALSSLAVAGIVHFFMEETIGRMRGPEPQTG